MDTPAAAPGVFDEETAECDLQQVFSLLKGLGAEISSRRGKEAILVPLGGGMTIAVGKHAPYWPQESWVYEVIYIRVGPPPVERTIARTDNAHLAACAAREAAKLARKPGADDE